MTLRPKTTNEARMSFRFRGCASSTSQVPFHPIHARKLSVEQRFDIRELGNEFNRNSAYSAWSGSHVGDKMPLSKGAPSMSSSASKLSRPLAEVDPEIARAIGQEVDRQAR